MLKSGFVYFLPLSPVLFGAAELLTRGLTFCAFEAFWDGELGPLPTDWDPPSSAAPVKRLISGSIPSTNPTSLEEKWLRLCD